MKYKIKKCLILTLLLLFLLYIITNNTIVSNNIIISLNMYYKNVLPYLFPAIVVTNLLTYNNFPYYLAKYLKINGETYIFIMSLLTGCPSNAVMIKNMLKENNINIEQAEKILCCTQFNNPIFLYNILKLSIPKFYSLSIISINYLVSIVIFLILCNKNKTEIKITKLSYSLSKSIILSIENSINTLLLILGTIVFFSIIPFPYSYSGLIEITTGLNSLKTLLLNAKLKSILAMIYISFGGLSIIMQIKSILSDTLITYKYYFKYRIIHLLLSMLLSYTLLKFQFLNHLLEY